MDHSNTTAAPHSHGMDDMMMMVSATGEVAQASPTCLGNRSNQILGLGG